MSLDWSSKALLGKLNKESDRQGVKRRAYHPEDTPSDFLLIRFDSTVPDGVVELGTDVRERAEKYRMALQEQARLDDSHFKKSGARFDIYTRLEVAVAPKPENPPAIN